MSAGFPRWVSTLVLQVDQPRTLFPVQGQIKKEEVTLSYVMLAE